MILIGETYYPTCTVSVAAASYLINVGRNGWEWNPSNWSSGAVTFGANYNPTTGSTSLYGGGMIGNAGFTAGGNLQTGNFGGGFNPFGQASYNEMPAGGTGSIDWRHVENQREFDSRTGSYNLQAFNDNGQRLPFNTSDNGGFSGATKAFLSSAGFVVAEDLVENFTFRLFRNNGSVFSPKVYFSGWNGGSVSRIKTYNVNTVFKGVGYGLGLFNYARLYSQRGNMTAWEFGLEFGSNTISTFGSHYGAAWGIGWELGRGVVNTRWYQRTIHNIYAPDSYECVLCPK